MLCRPFADLSCRLVSPRRLLRWAIASVACLLLVGCATTQKGTFYTPKTLPAKYLAGKRDNAQIIDLSRLASTAVNNDLIDRGDVIEVAISTGLNEKDNLTQPVRIREEDGVANVPIIGPLQLAGLQLEEAEAAISAAAIERGKYRNPNITVTMKRQKSNRVTVVGAVKDPGVKFIPRGQCDLLASLMAAGGLDEDAGTTVDIRNPVTTLSAPDPIAAITPDGVNAVGHSQPGQFASAGNGIQRTTLRVDLVKATKEGGGGYRVEDGAVVMVEKRDPEPVHVMGLVHKPDRYELPVGQDMTVMQALAKAGGVSSPVANKVFVIRKVPESSETFITTVAISDAKRNAEHDLRLSPGDVVSVEQTPLTVMIDTLRLMNFGFGASLPLTALF